jgi:hypothetical protein
VPTGWSTQPSSRATGCCCSATASSRPVDGGEFFGIDRLVDLVTRQESAGSRLPRRCGRLINAVLEHQQDMLQDDATVLLLEWAGDPRALLPA